MNVKEIIILCLIMCFIFSIPAITASDIDVDDTNNTVLTTADSDVVKQSNDLSSISLPENNTLLSDGEGSFSELKGHLSNDYTLDKDYKYSSSDTAYVNGITIDKSITIDGNGHSISGDGQARIFNIVEGATVTLKNIMFINGNAGTGNGGAIYSAGTINLENCTFNDNNAINGGAVYLETLPGKLLNLKFNRNHADDKGGAIYYHPSGVVGAEEDGLTDSVFTGNTAGNDGGALYLYGDNGVMRNVNFTRNIAANDGGAIMIIGTNWRVYDSTFNNNNATARRGGAIYLENSKGSTVSNSKFYNNTAGTNGGAIDWHNGAENGRVINTVFIDNTAKRSGGAIYWYGHNGTILSSNFTNNKALGSTYAVNPDGENVTGGDGGAVLWTGDLGTVDDCIFKFNTADKRGGAVFLRGTGEATCMNTSFTNSKFINNTAGTNGGAIDWNKGAKNGIIDNAVFINNTAKRSGGAVFWYGYNGTITNSNFTHNDALGVNNATSVMGDVTYGGDGGAVMWTGSLGIVDNCNFNDNEAAKRGGAVFLQGTIESHCTNTTFKNSNFTGNVAGTNGGAIDWNKGAQNGIIDNTVFIDNTAKRSGGAVFWYGYNGTIRNSNFTHNDALGVNNATSVMGEVTYGGDGGAVMWTGSLGIVDNCNFNENEAAKRGGAVFLQGTSEDHCTDTTFKNSNFTGNVAGTNGGAIDWNKGARNGIVYNVTFINNTAKRSGGAIFWNGHNGTISWAKFYNNRALGINNATSVMGDVTYGGDGGAVIWSGALGTVYFSNFVNNTAAKRGGAVFLQGTTDEDCDNTTFKNSYFANNIAGTNGGAIDWFAGAHHGIVDNVTFINNTAKRSGGAIFWHGNDGVVKNSKFTNNRATGEYLQYDMDLKFDDVIIVNNDTLPVTGGANKLYVLNYTSENGREFKSYVYDDEKWILLDETTVNVTTISPKDWAIDQFFGGDGGTILWSGDIGLVYNCTFVESNSARRGGGAYMTGSDYVTYELCTFTNCTSGTNGGGVDWLAGANYGKIYNCVFNNTRAARSAGAIYYDGWYGEMINITVIGTQSYGGSLKTSRDERVQYAGWDSSHWDTNTTGGDAGAIMFTGSHEYVYNVTFLNCYSVGRGGAIFLQGAHNVTIDDCNFTGNYARGIANNTWNDYRSDRDDSKEDTKLNYDLTGHGGAIAFDVDASENKIIKSHFIGNYARRDGGAIHFATGSFNNKIEYSEFNNSRAGDDGGAIFIGRGSGNFTIDHISCYNTTGESIHDTEIQGEDANSHSNGGVICVTGDNVTISNSDFDSNYIVKSARDLTYKYYRGAALYITGNDDKVYNSTFNNSGIKYGEIGFINGGTIYILGNNTIISGCDISNTAANQGGSIYISGNNATIIKTGFTNSSAYDDGGALFVTGEGCKLYNSTFTDNIAGDDGGAINWEGNGGLIYNITCINNRGISSTGSSNGGTICLTGNNTNVTKSNFTMTSAKIAGGAIFVTGNEVTISDSSFAFCSVAHDAPTTGKNYKNGGGSIYVLGNYSYIINCSFEKSNGRQGGVMYIQGHDVTVKDIKADFSYASKEGGSIFVEGANATISGSSFTRGNSTSASGGSIYVKGDNADIVNSNFTMSMSANQGGAIFVDGYNATISGGTCRMNNATNDGGCIFIKGDDTKILGVTFMQSHADKTGGMITVDGLNAYINGSSFSMSSSNYGGAIYIGGTAATSGYNATIENSKFDKNNATKDGGAIYIKGDLADVLDCEFSLATAYTGNGGGIYVGGNNATVGGAVSVMSSAVNGNGGFAYIQGNDVLVIDSRVMQARAKNGGAVYVDGKDTVINNLTTGMTTASVNGGAVYIGTGSGESGLRTTIKNSHFMMANATKAGGAVYINGQYATVENSTFSMTNAKSGSTFNTDNLGGAMYINGNDAKIIGSNFTISSAYNGGILYLNGQNCNVYNSSFDHGHTLCDGGAYYSTGTNSNVYNSNFTNNVAESDGGALMWLTSKNNYVNGCIFDNNTAHANQNSRHSTRGGGAIYFAENGEYCGISYSKFFRNSVQTDDKADGGAILWDKSSHIFIDHCLFDGNFVYSDQTSTTADDKTWVQGGVMYARPANNLTISNSIFQNCWSSKEAGALYLQNGGTIGIKVINNTFINNTAYSAKVTNDNDYGGGAVLVKGTNGPTVFINSTFINNTGNYGGGISFIQNTGTITLTNATFDGNKAIFGGQNCGLGGGIYAVVKVSLNNITFLNGEAALNGGGLYLGNVEAPYTDLTFINNTAVNGGGLYWDRTLTDKTPSCIIDGMTFINNHANNGGGIYLPRGGRDSSINFQIKNGNFTGNSAQYGGAIYANGGHTYISNNNFTNNTAEFGGAIYTSSSASSGVDIGYSNFIGNNASYGGAIYSLAKGYNDRNIHDCNFINNTATSDGGAIFVANHDQIINNCNFNGNKANGDGGAVYVMEDINKVTIKDSTFTNSRADNGGAVYYGGTSSAGNYLKILNGTFLKNIAIHNGGAILYVTNNGFNNYRDYNNFDGIGIPVDGDRTTVRTNGTNIEIITSSLFEDNHDYAFLIRVISDREYPFIAVYLDNPRDWRDNYKLRFVVNLTNATTHEVIQTVIVNSSNIDTHYRDGMLYVSFSNLIMNETYNITASFEDANYMYKENSTEAQAHGEIIGQFKLLQKLIEDALERGDDYIILNRTFTFTPEYMGKTENMDDSCINLTNINRPFTIYGNGWSIDAAGYSRIFNITSPYVTIKDVVLVGGNASGKFGDGVDKGGAIFWAGANGTISGSTLIQNNATLGGGIYYNVTAPNCQIINTLFERNNAVTNGGAIDCNASRMGLFNTTFEENTAYTGAALCREINATEGHGKNNTFIGNYAEYAGAALAWINATRISIDDYHFYDNHVGYSGGAIYVGEGSKECEVLNCVFGNNWVDDEVNGHGGAIEWYSEKGTVYNSVFTNNHANNGGAIYVGHGSTEINVTKSTFSDNYAITVGGAISIEASAVILNESNFYNNTATKGGALYVGGEGTDNYIYSSVFEGNKAINDKEPMNALGGAIEWVASSGTIVDTRFTSNYADYGGGVYFGGRSNESTIKHCLFEDNEAKYNGGAIDCNASKMYLTNTVFDGNIAQFGAALCRETNAKSGSGENNTFKNNHAYISGAALGWMGSVGIKITNYTFINNSADVAGGAIYVSPTSHNCSIIDCNFEDNYVTNETDTWVSGGQFSWTAWDGSTITYRTEWETSRPSEIEMLPSETIYYYADAEDLETLLGTGGAITIFAANAKIVNTNFTGNSARLGGGVYVGANSGSTQINNTVWRANIASERGGAINLHASAVHIDDGEFYDNIAVNGSALYVGGTGTENKVHESIFQGNNATGYGGAIYWIADVGEIYNSDFTKNSAEYGGAIYLNGRSANTDIINDTFRSNSAVKNGGAIECNASNIGIYNLIFEDNYAGEYGAALCREIGATSGHGTNNTFNRNHAGISGAALAWMGVKNIHIIDYKFVNNTAESSGGAIFIDEGSNNDIIENCTFEGNHLTNMTVGHNGGAIDCRGENLTIDYVNFTNNGAHTGGAIYMGSHSNTIRIFDANFTNNYAIADGGALGLKADSLTINNTYFTSNTAGRHGGAVYAGGNGTNNTIRYAAFVGNSAGDHGGAIDWLASAGTFEYINFRANTAEYGGAIYLNGVSSNSTLNTIYFIENRATKNGGAIDCNATRMGLSNVQFISNYAGEYGAALCREANATGGFGGNNTFISNHADIAGAALAWLGVDNININNYTFINNTAYSSGGAIYVREDSPNCKVRNCYFDNNYVTDVRNGQGGAIDWLGDHGYIYNTTFENSFAVNGGTLYVGIVSEDMNITDSRFTGSRAVGEGGSIVLYGDNVNIIRTNFTYSIGLTRGGAISAYQAHNITVVDCIFDHTVGAGYVDQSNTAYGDGGAIYLKDGSNLNITNVKFQDVESHAMGTVTVINCSDSVIYNSTFSGMFALAHGGSVAWINSTNVTVDKCNFIDSGASYEGGSIFFNNTNAVVKNSLFNNTSTPWGNGGAIYINGNVTIDNSTFDEYTASKDNAGAIYLHGGNSTISNSSFNGRNAIWIAKNANATISEINITGDNPNDDLKYLEKDYNSETNPVFYAIWNDGHLYLKGNNFDYVSFNNGTIWSQTYVYMLSNETYNITWMDEFTFWAEILDDTQDNHIISVDSMYATNDVHQEGGGKAYPMTYNRVYVPEVYYQGAFHLRPNDPNLKKYDYKNGTVNVKMPLKLNLTYEIVGDVVKVTAQLTPKAKSNFTLKDDNLYFKINDKEYYPVPLECTPTKEGDFWTWTLAIAKCDLNNLSAGHYTITAYHPGDEVHWDVINSTSFDFEKRKTWIKILIENTVYGVYPIANVTTNGNGTVLLSMNGRTERYDLSKNATYKDGVYTLLVRFDSLYAPGNYTMSAVYEADEYYDYSMNNTDFEIFKRNVTISANATDIKFVEVEYINATLSIIIREGEEVNVTELQPISGYVRVVLAQDQEYAAKIIDGVAKFRIPNLFSAEFKNVEVSYDGDYFYNGNMTYINFTVAPTDDFTVDVKVDNITYGQNATVRVKVPSWANGTVTIYVDGIEWGTVNITDGTAQLTNVTGLAGGDHVVNATYNGGQYYAAKNSTNVTFNVAQKSDWDVAIIGDYHPYGEYSTFTVRNIPEGIGNNITIRIDDVDYVLNVTVNGTAVLKLNNLTAGKHNGTVVYAGNANYSSLNKKFYPDIPKATPTVTLIQNGTDLVAVVSGNVTGNVTFRVNGDSYYTVNLTANNATLIGKLRIGDNYVIATYNGNGNYTTADAANVFTVDKLNTTITVNSTNIKFGENEIINVTVDERAEGFIAINIDGKIYVEYVNHGVAQFNITGLAAKNYTDVRVTYYPATSDFNGNFTTTSFIVDPTDKYPIDVKVDNITYGQNATVRVLVATDAVGNVTISIDGKINKTVNLTNGVAVWENIAGLAGGEHVVNVTYNGGPRYAPKDHNGTVFKVNPASWKVDITEVDYRPYGQTTTINITNIPADFKGKNLTIKIDGISYVVPIVDGKATLRLNNLSAGSHMATVNYAGDANYSNISQVFRPNIPQAIPTIALEEVNGDIVATVSGVNATGNVTFYLNGKEYTIDLTSGRTATLTKDYLIIGNNSVVAIYNGDKNYTSARTVGNFTVDKLASTVTVTVVDTEYGIPVEVIVQVGENQTGFVEIYVNGLTYVGELKQGEARFYIMGLNVNKYTVNVTYYENDIYHSSKNSTSFNVTKADITATVVAQNVTVEQNASFAINNVTRDFNGNVTIVINGHVYYNGTVKSPIEIARIIQANNYTANVTFYGDNNYNNKSYPVNFTVSRVDPTIDVTIADVTYPAIASAIVTVSNGATGAIGIYLGDVLVGSGTITDGQATTIDLIRLAAGLNKEVTVKFITSDDYNNNATATAEFNVIKGNTTVSIERNGTDVIAVVTPGVSGNVTFIINGEEFENVTVNGNATIVDKLHIGNNTVSVIYRGNENYTGNDSATVFEIVKITTALTVEATPEVVVGKNTTIIVRMTNVTSGRVLIDVNGYNYTVDINSSGVAKLVVALPVDDYTAHAYYLGDLEHEACDNVSAVFKVLNKTAPSVTIADVGNIEIDTNLTFTVTTNSNATLVVRVNGEVVNQSADGKYRYNGTVAKEYNITASVAENDYYFKASNYTLFNVYKHASEIASVVAAPKNVIAGKNTTVTVTMANNESGKVMIEIGGHNYTVEINDQHKAVLVVALPAGNYTAHAYYLGDDKYNATDKVSAEFNVTAKRNATVIINAVSVVEIDGKLVFNVTNSTPVVVTINDVVYTPVNGNYTFDAKVVGNYTIVARSNETDDYYAGFDTKVFSVVKRNSTVKVEANSINVTGTVRITITAPSDIDGLAKVDVNGTVYAVNITSGHGLLELKNLNAGYYPVNITYLENDKYLSSTDDTGFTVSKLNATVVINAANSTYGGTETITVTVPGAEGDVTIKLNDTGATSITQKLVDGKAVFNITELNAGNYSVEVTYNGSSIYNINDTESATFEVGKADPGLYIQTFSCVVYENATIEISINPETAGGKLNITVGDDKYADIIIPNNGLITFKTTNPLNEYKYYAVTVVYAGNDNFNASEFKGSYSTTKVNTFGIKINAMNITVGEDEIITVEVPNHVDDVVIWVNGEKYRNASFTGNAAKFNITGLNEGIYTVTARVNDTEFEHKNFTAMFTVNKTYPTIDITVINETSIHVADKVTVIVTVPSDVKDNVTIMIGDIEYSKKPVNGNATFEIEGLTAGVKTVTAFYYGDEKYRFNATVANFTVSKYDAFVNITVEDKYEIGSLFNITIANATVVNVTINGEKYIINATTGNVIIDTTKLAAGNYTVTATIYESGKYLGNVTSDTFEIYKHASDIESVVATPTVVVGKNTTVTVTMANNESGKVMIEINGHNYTVEINNQHKAVLVVALPAGNYTAHVYYLGDDKYNATDKVSAEFNVTAKRNATVIINAGEVVEIDGKLIFNVTNSTPVVVTINDVVYTPVNGNYTFDAVKAGNYTIVARSVESDEYYAGFNSTTFRVIKHNSSVNITVGNKYEIETSFEIGIQNSTVVNVTINGKVYNVVGGKVSIDTAKLAAGNYTVTATIYESDRYCGNVTSKTFEITKHASQISIKTSPIDVGQIAVINITASNYNGSAIVNLNNNNYSVVITNGIGQLKVSDLRNGTYDITVTYVENDRYTSNTNETTLTVSKVASFLNVEVKTPISSGDDEVITFTLPSDATGNITVIVNKVTYSVAVSGGKGTLTIQGLHKGDYVVNATYNGDDKYSKYINTNKTFKVIQHSTDMVVVDERNRTVVIHLQDNATGKVFVGVGGKVYNATVANGTAVVTLTDAAPGVHQAHISYVSDNADFNDTEAIAEVHIPKYETPISANVSVFKVGDVGYINVTLPNGTTGMVIIEVNGKSFNTTDIVNGVARFEIGNLTYGNKTFIIEYSGDDNYMANDTASTLEVIKHDSGITVAVDNIDVGGIAQINVTGPSDIQGVVVVNVGGVDYNVFLNEGKGSVKVANLANGTYDITATYLENTKYLSRVNDTVKVTVSKVTPEIKASVENITDDKNAAFEITLPEDATGTVTIKVNDTTSITVGVTGGVNKVLVENLKAGEYNVNITYNGNDRYNSAKANVTLKVTKAVPPVVEGVQVIDQGNGTVKIVVPGNSTGNVTIKVGNETYNATVENGTAIIDLNNVTPGRNDITIKYVDENGQTAEINSTVNIPKYATPITIKVTDGVVGTPVEITVTVDGNITGEITIEVDGKNYTKAVENGKAVFTVDLTAGDKTVTATYAGDDEYLFNSTTEQFKVSKLPAPMSVSASVSGKTATITVSDLPGDATGYVIVKVNDVEYGINITSTKQVTVPITQTGTYNVVASYLGDDKYMANSSSTSFHATIGEDNITIDLSNTTVGSDLVIKVDVPQDADGNITVTVDNKTITQKVTPGENVITVPGLGEGSHDVNVTYSGDSKYDSKTVVQTVYIASTINAHDKQTRGWDSPYDFSAEFLDKEGHVLKNTDVQIQVNGKTYTVKTDTEGIAYLTESNLPVGTYDVVCINTVTGENVTFKLTIVKRILENKDLTMDFDSGKSFTVKVIGDDGNPAPAGEYVAITVNGIKYASITDANGYASLKINLNPKTYTITAEYKNTKVSNKLVVKQTLKLVKKTVSVKKGKKLILKATLKWSNGKAIKGKVIKFKFNGKTYKAKTNSKGLAKVTVKAKVTKKLKKGKKYAYSATYISNTVKGKVKIK